MFFFLKKSTVLTLKKACKWNMISFNHYQKNNINYSRVFKLSTYMVLIILKTV